MLELLPSAVEDVSRAIAGPGSRLFIPYLLATLPFAYLAYRLQGGVPTRFLAWAMSRKVWSHRSTLVDIKLLVLGRMMTGLGLFSAISFSAVATLLVMSVFGADTTAAPSSDKAVHPALLAVMFLVISDFSVYWVHRIHHESGLFWPFHAVHHSAEVMTPLTVYRKHPLYDLTSQIVRSVFVGGLLGLILALSGGTVEIKTLLGVNAGVLIFNALGANLRHSHVWLSYGRVLEHVFISPAQHQVHHSRAPEHHDRNYGEVFALWDWMFGTLYVTKGREKLSYGLAEADGTPIAQPHTGLRSALTEPFREAAAHLASSPKTPARTESWDVAE